MTTAFSYFGPVTGIGHYVCVAEMYSQLTVVVAHGWHAGYSWRPFSEHVPPRSRAPPLARPIGRALHARQILHVLALQLRASSSESSG